MPSIQLSFVTGATPTAQLYLAGAATGSPIAMTEVATTGEYQADPPTGTAAGQYLVVFFDGAVKIASGQLAWNGEAEISIASVPTAQDVAAEVWTADARTLTESAGLTDEQAAQLTNVETLAEALPTATQTAAAVLGAQVESGASVVQSLRLANAVLGGKVSGGQTGTEIFRDLSDTKDVVVSTNDAAGNRTAVVKNLG